MFTITHDLPLLQDNVEKLQDKLGDLTPLMEDIGAVLENSTRQRFADKQAPIGTAWANLMPNTLKQKDNTGGGILVASGNLAQSIAYHADKYSTSVGTSESYGAYHQFGTAHMVARPFLGLSRQDEDSIYKLINEYLTAL